MSKLYGDWMIVVGSNKIFYFIFFGQAELLSSREMEDVGYGVAHSPLWATTPFMHCYNIIFLLYTFTK
jgi:hypothetical protein